MTLKTCVTTFLTAAFVFIGNCELIAQGTGQLYGTASSSDFERSDLLKINPNTGVGTVLGWLPVGGAGGAAVDPNSGDLYFVSGFLSSLYRIDASGLAYLDSLEAAGLLPLGDLEAAGLVHLVGPPSFGLAVVGSLDFAPDGTLYAAVSVAGSRSSGSEQLGTINTSTGAGTMIGVFGTCSVISPFINGACTLEGMQGIAFDGLGNLWGAIRKNVVGSPSFGAPGVYLIDISTGTASFVSSIHDAADNEPGNGVVSLQFSCDGILFGGTAGSAGLAAGRLLTINGATGLFSFIGTTPATQFGKSLNALAFGTGCPTVVIDIKPDDTPNSINRKSNGQTPVAVLGSAVFAVTSIDVSTVRFTGAPALSVGEAAADVNGDGYLDRVLHFSTTDLNLPDGATSACFTGRTISGLAFRSCDSVNLVN